MMMEMEWPSRLDEYEKLVIRMNTPRFVWFNSLFDFWLFSPVFWLKFLNPFDEFIFRRFLDLLSDLGFVFVFFVYSGL